MSTVSPTQTMAGDETSIDTAQGADMENLEDDTTLVNLPSRPVDIHWTPQSRFQRFYNTATFPLSSPLVYVPGDPEADWAEVPQGGTNTSFFRKVLHFIISKLRSFFERLARMTFVTASL